MLFRSQAEQAQRGWRHGPGGELLRREILALHVEGEPVMGEVLADGGELADGVARHSAVVLGLRPHPVVADHMFICHGLTLADEAGSGKPNSTGDNQGASQRASRLDRALVIAAAECVCGPQGRKVVGQRPRPWPIVGGMHQEEIWDVDAAKRYDTPGTGMFAPEVLGPTVDRLALRA